jgi:alanine racemase
MAVLKADGYGHGATPLARVASVLGHRLWGFGVSSVEEGLALRESGRTEKILILGSLYPFESYDVVLKNKLIPTVASRVSAQALSLRAPTRDVQPPVMSKSIRVWDGLECPPSRPARFWFP